MHVRKAAAYQIHVSETVSGPKKQTIKNEKKEKKAENTAAVGSQRFMVWEWLTMWRNCTLY